MIDDHGMDDYGIEGVDLPGMTCADDPLAQPDYPSFDSGTQSAIDIADRAMSDAQAELDAALVTAGLPDTGTMPTGVDATLDMLDTVAADVDRAMESTDIAEIEELTDGYAQRNATLEAHVRGEEHWRDVIDDIQASEEAIRAQEALSEAALVEQQAQFAIDNAERALGDR